MKRSVFVALMVGLLVFVALVNFSSAIPKAQKCKVLAYFRRSCDSGGPQNEAAEVNQPAPPAPPAPPQPNCNSTHPFPKVVHLIWKDKEAPPSLRPFVASWKKHNSDWEVKLWDDASLATFLREQLPASKFEQWQSFPSAVGKIDVARLLLMELVGGVYSDLDVMCYACLNTLLGQQGKQNTLLLPHEYQGDPGKPSQDGIISNFWMASIPNASAIRYLVDNLPIKVGGQWQWVNASAFSSLDPDPSHNGFNGVLDTAGPRFIGQAYSTAPKEIQDSINVLPSQAWAFIWKEDIWRKSPDFPWQDHEDLRISLERSESFGLHFHAGNWWNGPAHHKFYDQPQAETNR